jgi:NADH:ubiquinone oxidoreductase subunit 3 (subunit A)
MDKLINVFLISLGIIIAVLIGLKFIFFERATSRKSLKRFFYFSKNSIYNSATNKKTQAKIFQNRLSLAVAVLFVVLSLWVKVFYFK